MQKLTAIAAAFGLIAATPAAAQEAEEHYDVSKEIENCFTGLKLTITENKPDAFTITGRNRMTDTECGYTLTVGGNMSSVNTFASVVGKGAYTYTQTGDDMPVMTLQNPTASVTTNILRMEVTYQNKFLDQDPETRPSLEKLAQEGKIAIKTPADKTSEITVVEILDDELKADGLPDDMMSSMEPLLAFSQAYTEQVYKGLTGRAEPSPAP